jgi:hypothetical protein
MRASGRGAAGGELSGRVRGVAGNLSRTHPTVGRNDVWSSVVEGGWGRGWSCSRGSGGMRGSGALDPG